MASSTFDLGRYVRNSKAVQVDDLAWNEVAEHPLTQAEVRFLHYMMNIEAHTIVYLKELLSTKVIEDAEVTAFLSCWGYEEYFHGAALEKFLTLYVGAQNVRNDTAYRLGQQSRTTRLAKRVVAGLLAVSSDDFAATHMTWGAAQELTTLTGYESVARQTQHPVLKELMTRIIKDERRHYAFYYNQAEKRLLRWPRMQGRTRWLMEHVWRPVGTGAMPAVDSDFSGWYLFRHEAGQHAVRVVDSALAQLPGMAGWKGLERHIAAAIQRVNGWQPAATMSLAVQPPHTSKPAEGRAVEHAVIR